MIDFITVTLLAVSTALVVCAVIAARGRRTVSALCAMTSASCGYANALMVHHVSRWISVTLVAIALGLLATAIAKLVRGKRAVAK